VNACLHWPPIILIASSSSSVQATTMHMGWPYRYRYSQACRNDHHVDDPRAQLRDFLFLSCSVHLFLYGPWPYRRKALNKPKWFGYCLIRPETQKNISGGCSHYTDASEPVDGNWAQNMVTVQSRFTVPTRLPRRMVKLFPRHSEEFFCFWS
jgi:hypothetical protein